MGTASMSVVGVVAGCMVAAAAAFSWSLLHNHRELRKVKRRVNKPYRLYKQDLADVNNQVCACCGGYATRVRLVQPENLYLCEDRKLCQATMAVKSQLDSMRD